MVGKCELCGYPLERDVPCGDNYEKVVHHRPDDSECRLVRLEKSETENAELRRHLAEAKQKLATARAEALKAAANHDDYDPGDIVDNGVVTFTAFRDYVRRVVRNANAHWRAVLSLAATPTVPTPRKPRERTVSDGHCRPITSDKQDDPSLIDDIDRCIKETLSGISLQHPSAHKQALTNQVVILQAVKMILEDAKTPPAVKEGAE